MNLTDYHADHLHASKSKLDTLHASPFEYATKYLYPHLAPDHVRQQWAKEADARHFVIGQALDDVVTSGIALSSKYFRGTSLSRSTTEGKAQHAQRLIDNPGKTWLSPEEWEEVQGMAKAIAASPFAPLIDTATSQRTYYWTDPTTGLSCKCRPDWLMPGAIVDVKSTEDASAEAFMRSAYNYQYHLQAAFYMDGMAAVWGEIPEAFMFLAHEKTAPWASAYYFADGEMIEAGRAEYRKALRLYADCLSSDKWPGYSQQLQPLGLPRWAKREET